VVLLPAVGIVAEVMCAFSRKKLFGLQDDHLHVIATGVLSFFVWAHHQFVAGIDPRMANVFTVTTVLISIPIAEMCFAYIATLYGGSIRSRPRCCGRWRSGRVPDRGVTGIYLGASGLDIFFHDTYFVVAISTTRSSRSRSSR
jgi:cytochrome c oxidase subunit 1